MNYIKVKMYLKESQKKELHKWYVTFKGEIKEVFSGVVEFYLETLEGVDKVFDMSEVRCFYISYETEELTLNNQKI